MSRTGSTMRVVGDMGQFAGTVLAQVASARRQVDIECFIVRDDRLGRALADALVQAARRGVRCRLIYDALGSRHTRRRHFRELRRAGVGVQAYGWIGALLLGRPAARDHARIVVVDGRVAYTGGHAWGDEWLPARLGGCGWRDVCCEARGNIVNAFAELFEQHWRQASGRARPADYDSGESSPQPRLLSDAPKGRSMMLRNLVEAVASARRRVWMANAYFFPPPRLLQALVVARQRGADVRLIVPGRTDLPIVQRAARSRYRSWLAAGLQIWEYDPAVVMHSKYALVDDSWCQVGTFNTNDISVAVAIEVGLVGRSPEAIKQVERELEADLARSMPVDLQILARRSWRKRLLDWLAGRALGLVCWIVRRPAARRIVVAADDRPSSARLEAIVTATR